MYKVAKVENDINRYVVIDKVLYFDKFKINAKCDCNTIL